MKDPRDAHFLSIIKVRKQGQIDAFEAYMFWLKQEQYFLLWLIGLVVTGLTVGASQLQFWTELLDVWEIWLLAFLVCSCLLAGFEYRISLNETFKYYVRLNTITKAVFDHEEMKMAEDRNPESDEYAHVLRGLEDLGSIRSNSEFLRLIRAYQSSDEIEKKAKLEHAKQELDQEYEAFHERTKKYLNNKYNNGVKIALGEEPTNIDSENSNEFKLQKDNLNRLRNIFYWSFRFLIILIFVLILVKS